VKEEYMIFFPLAMGLWHMIAQICIAGSNIPLSSSSPPLDDKPESFPTIDVEPCSLAVRGVKNFGDSMLDMDRFRVGVSWCVAANGGAMWALPSAHEQ
jgi:hypothetical protein